MTLFQNKYRVETARFRGWDYRSRGWYFVTICTQGRACIFGSIANNEMQMPRIGGIAELDLRKLGKHYENVQVDSFVVMPNHVHAIIVIEGDHGCTPNPIRRAPLPAGFSPPAAGSLSAIVRSYKAGVTRQCHELGLEKVVWQARFHDRTLRGDAVISAVREYIWNNPANWAEDNENSSSLPNFVET